VIVAVISSPTRKGSKISMLWPGFRAPGERIQLPMPVSMQ
jgi:hypothetical protein